MDSQLVVGGNTEFKSTVNHIGDVSMDSVLFVGGDVSLNSKLYVLNDVSMDSQLVVGGNTKFKSTVNHIGDVSMDSQLVVGGNTDFKSTVNHIGDVSMDSVLFVGGDVSLNSKLYVLNDVSMDSQLVVGGNTEFKSTVNHIGDVSMDSVLFVGGDVSLNSKLYVLNDVSMDSQLVVGGNTKFKSTVNHIGDVSMDSVLLVGGDVSLNSKLYVNNDVSLNSRLYVNGDISLNSNVTVSGDLQIYGKLDVNQIQNTNTINTTVNEYTLVVTEDLSINGGLSISEDLSLNGNANISNKILVDKNGDVIVTNKNMVIGNSVYLSTMVANSIFDNIAPSNIITNTFLSNNDSYVIRTSSYNIKSSDNAGSSAFVNNTLSWKSGFKDQDNIISYDPYSGTGMSGFLTYIGDISTNYNNNSNNTQNNQILGEYIEIEFPYDTLVNNYEIHTDIHQVPSHGILLGYDESNSQWEFLHEYSIISLPSSSYYFNITNVIQTKKLRFVIDKITSSSNTTLRDNTSQQNIIYSYNVAIRYINFSGTILNTGISVGAGYSQNTANTSMGFGTLAGNINGKNNIALGNYTLSQTRTSDNIAIGYNALVNNLDGIQNIAIGSDTQLNNTYGNKNITIGHASGYSNNIGSNNTFIGNNSGYSNYSGSNNTLIGVNSDVSGICSHSTAIGYDAVVTDSNQIVIGTENDNVKIPGTIQLNGIFSGDVSFNENVEINGTTKLNSTLNVNGASTLNSLNVTNTTTTNNLNVTGTSSFNNLLSVTNGGIQTSELIVTGQSNLQNTLSVSKATTLNSTLSVSKRASLSSTLFVTNDVSLNSKLYVNNDVSMNSKLNVGGNTQINGTLDVTDTTQLNTVNASGNATIDGILTSSNNVLFNGQDTVPKLTITTGSNSNKTTTLINDVINIGTTANTLDNTNFITINRENGNNQMNINGTTGTVALSVTGTIEGTDIRITGGGTIQTTGETINTSIRTLVGDLSSGMALQPINYDNITGATNPPAATGLEFIPQTNVDSNGDPILYESGYVRIDASGNMVINKNLTVNQDTSLNNFTTIGDTSLNNLYVANATSLNSTLNVDGATTLASSLTVTGNSSLSNLTVSNTTTLSSTLNVTKTTTLSSTLNVNGSTSLNDTLTVSKDSTFNSDIDISGNLSLLYGQFTINDISFGVTNLPTSVTGDFDNNQKILYSQYSGTERVFNGIYDISASSFVSGYEPWKAFDLSDGTYWKTNNGTISVPTSSTTYIPISGGSSTDLSGEYIQIEYPFNMKVNQIFIRSFDDELYVNEGITQFKLLGIQNNEWYEIHNYDGNAILDTTSVNISSSVYSNKYRLIVISTNNTSVYAAISHLSFYGDVIGSKIHIDNANIGIGNVNPRSALEITGDMVISNSINGENTSGNSIEHGRIMWGGINRDISNNYQSSYIRSYFKNGTYDTSGNLAFGTSDGSSSANDKFVINANGINNFITDVSMDSDLAVNGDGSFNSNLYIKQKVWVDGTMGIGTENPVVVFDVSDTGALRLPVGITQDRPVNTTGNTSYYGSIRYNTTNSQFEGYGPGGAWGSLGGVINVAQNTKILAADPAPDSSNNQLTFYTNGGLRMIIESNGDISMNEKLNVIDATTLKSTLNVANDVSMDTVLAVGGDVSLNSKLFVANDVSMDTVLAVGGDVSLNSKLFVANDVSMDTVLAVGGDVSLNSKLFVANDVSMNSELTVIGNVNLNSKVIINTPSNTDGIMSIKCTDSPTNQWFNGVNILAHNENNNASIMIARQPSNNPSNDTGKSFVTFTNLGISDWSIGTNSTQHFGIKNTWDYTGSSQFEIEHGGNKINLNTDVDISGDLLINGNLEVKQQQNTSIINTTVNDYQLIITEDISLNGNFTSSGDISLNGNINVGGNASVTGSVYASSFASTSDYRIKENVIPIYDTSYNTDNIRPVFYTNKLTDKPDFGVIAHELQQHFPFLVNGEKDSKDNQSVNYNGLIGLLINEIQQLKIRVNELEKSKP